MLKKTLALLLVFALAMGSGLSMAEVAAPTQEITQPADPVLATVGGDEVLKSEVDAIIPQLETYMNEEGDYAYAVEFVVQQRLMAKKIAELGFDQFENDVIAAFAAEAQTQWDDGIESYISFYLSEDTQAARDTLREEAIAFYTEQGFSVDSLTANAKQRAAFDRMTEYLMGDYAPTEDEVQATFQLFGGSYQEEYQDNIMSYEYNTLYNQQPSWYTPEGYRGIIHILLQPDAALMDNYSRLLAAFEEQQSDLGSDVTDTAEENQEAPSNVPQETPDAITQEPVTQEMVDAARQAILDSKQTELDQISARLAGGESFEALVKELGQDPGMQSDENLSDGYKVHRDSIAWDPAFTQAAFSDKMQQVGDVSEPVVGTNGIHILKYLRDVPSGLIMTDAIHQEIIDYLIAVKENEVFMQAFEAWKQELPVVLMEDALEAATNAARLESQLEPSDTLQALPEEVEELQAPVIP